MSEGGIAICIFSAVVIALSILLVYLGDRQDKKRQENKEQENENNQQSARGLEEGKGANGTSGSRRYVRIEGGGKELAGAAEKGKRRRAGRKTHGKINGVDAGDRGVRSNIGQSPTRD